MLQDYYREILFLALRQTKTCFHPRTFELGVPSSAGDDALPKVCAWPHAIKSLQKLAPQPIPDHTN